MRTMPRSEHVGGFLPPWIASSRSHSVRWTFWFVDHLPPRSGARESNLHNKRVVVETDSFLRVRPEFASVLASDRASASEIGLAKVAGARQSGRTLAPLFDGSTPVEFGAAVNGFLDRCRHGTLRTELHGIPTTCSRFGVCLIPPIPLAGTP